MGLPVPLIRLKNAHRLFGFVLMVGLLASSLLGSGCSGSKPQSYVTGMVSLDGEPVGGGSILFIDEKGQTANAPLQEDGQYSLKCSPGSYRVAISPPPAVDPLAAKSTGQPAAPTIKIPKAYQEVRTSGLMADVAAGTNTHEFELDSKVKK
ncbi:hypothetical protein [Schlesneria sp.]|uniref:hypothetical protein n=1 Tax=Schlesneria sp. TaxID=2762018 RepID=UPI002F1E1A70